MSFVVLAIATRWSGLTEYRTWPVWAAYRAAAVTGSPVGRPGAPT